ncbi:hypothetical protein [Viridibacillus arvi]|uniref:hypothetical protein n=1 Tax=Viridibacillus arvi TaxID=263475 RepID=UPI0034CECB75
MKECTIMKSVEEINEEINRNVALVGKMIQKQREGIPLNESDVIIRREANYRINSLFWVLGEYN